MCTATIVPEKPLPNNTNYTRNQSPHNSSYRGRSPERRNTQNSSQNYYNRPNSRITTPDLIQTHTVCF